MRLKMSVERLGCRPSPASTPQTRGACVQRDGRREHCFAGSRGRPQRGAICGPRGSTGEIPEAALGTPVARVDPAGGRHSDLEGSGGILLIYVIFRKNQRLAQEFVSDFTHRWDVKSKATKKTNPSVQTTERRGRGAGGGQAGLGGSNLSDRRLEPGRGAHSGACRRHPVTLAGGSFGSLPELL